MDIKICREITGIIVSVVTLLFGLFLISISQRKRRSHKQDIESKGKVIIAIPGRLNQLLAEETFSNDRQIEMYPVVPQVISGTFLSRWASTKGGNITRDFEFPDLRNGLCVLDQRLRRQRWQERRGKFCTPAQVVRLLVRFLKLVPLKLVSDSGLNSLTLCKLRHIR